PPLGREIRRRDRGSDPPCNHVTCSTARGYLTARQGGRRPLDPRAREPMPESHEFLRSFALVLCVAAATPIVFQRLRQPVVFGYLLAGMIVGRHVPIPLLANEAMVHTLSELGVILLMFALGLEFSLRKLFAVGPTAGVIAVLQTTTMVALGYLAGQRFGWTGMESIYAGAVIALART